MIVFAASMAVVFVAGFAFRAWHLRSIERLSTDRRPLGADGIVVGAEGFTLARAEAPAVLLIHGAGDTPQTLRYLGDALFANGFHVEAPLLPGHGRTLAAFRRTSADDWMNAVRSSYSALQCDHDWVAIAGLSMGGALAIRVAAESPQLPALCLIAPYLALREGADRAARLSHWWGPIFPVVESSEGFSVLDPAERAKSLAYGVFSAAALRALRETVRKAYDALPRVAAPTLFVQSREDNRITIEDAERAFSRLGAREKVLEWVSGAAHVVTVDYGRDRVFRLVSDWLFAHKPAALPDK
ncbi:MAG TPA: alpha/beta fold hydrolase [Gemmatimonadaceae bacterium]|jgi:carboxylesterase|nr:alpha/beta fold hydrolase [Gemmatimonadaceae bacterium]